jgi:hypothetical protein
MILEVLIAFRIQRTRHRVSFPQQYMHDHAGSALAVIIETGTVYSVAIVALIITYLAGSNVQFIFLDMVGHSGCYVLIFSPYIDTSCHWSHIQYDYAQSFPWNKLWRYGVTSSQPLCWHHSNTRSAHRDQQGGLNRRKRKHSHSSEQLTGKMGARVMDSEGQQSL